MKIRELLKALMYVVWNVFYEIFQQAWKPLSSTIIKTALVSIIILFLVKFVPHNIPFIRDVNYFGWFTIICVYRLISFKYDDFSDEDIPIETEDTIPINVDDQEEEDIIKNKPIVAQPSQNIKMKEDLNGTSTRE